MLAAANRIYGFKPTPLLPTTPTLPLLFIVLLPSLKGLNKCLLIELK
jgi:hypothetical protein